MATEKVTYELSLRDLMSKSLGDINSKLGKLENQLDETGKKSKSATDGMGSSFKQLGSIIATYLTADAVKSLVLTSARFQTLGNSIKFASDDAIQGQLSMNWIGQMSKDYGLSIEATTEGFKTFQGALIGSSFSSSEARKMFEQVSTGVVAMGLSAEDAKGTFLALGQIVGKGKVQAEELRGQIGERIPGAFSIAARAMSMSTMELDKFMSDGKLLAEDFLPKFAAEMEKTFGAGALDNTDSVTSNLNRLSSAWLNLQLAIASSDGGLVNATIKGWGTALDWLADKFKTVTQLSQGSANKGVMDLTAYYEDDLSKKSLAMQKRGLSKDQIEQSLKGDVTLTQSNWAVKQKELEAKKSQLEKDKIFSKENAFSRGTKYMDTKEMYSRDSEYKATLDQLETLKLGSKAIGGVLDREVSALYKDPVNGGASKKAKDKALKEQVSNVSGGVPKNVYINIDALIKGDINNMISNVTNPDGDLRVFMQNLERALLTVVNDVNIVSDYGK